MMHRILLGRIFKNHSHLSNRGDFAWLECCDLVRTRSRDLAVELARILNRPVLVDLRLGVAVLFINDYVLTRSIKGGTEDEISLCPVVKSPRSQLTLGSSSEP